jgi:hypothetical protein
MKEKRQYERFILPLPVRLETIELGRKKVLDLNSKDISASGTFIITLTSFPEETRFILNFTIPSKSIKKRNNAKSLKGLTGSIVRSNPHGIAIRFDRECQIESLKSL